VFQKPEIDSWESYLNAYKRSLSNSDEFWAEVAETFDWTKKWEKVSEGDFTDLEIKWFDGGETNLATNCIDRHLKDLGNKPAIIWESNDPNEESRTLTFKELHFEVCRFSNVLIKNGIKKGDRVCLYMPMTPEAAIAMLSCARIGAIHSVVFGGFSAQALRDRINDSQCKIVLTADSTMRGLKEVRLKDVVDEALKDTPSIERVIVQKRTGNKIDWNSDRDRWWDEEHQGISSDNDAVAMKSEDPLFLLYTSGSTGKPKGLMHTTAGYMVYAAYTFRNVFQPKEGELYWCSADVGWITGHSYLVYGPLLNGITTLMFEGVPNYPTPSRFWEVIDKYKVNIFYTAPTAIRALEQSGVEFVRKNDLSSLRVLGTVGEPINHEAWEWYNKEVGKEKCPIVDTWWQTETGGMMISPLAGITELKPTFATYPLPGVDPVLVNDKGQEVENDGNLCIRLPWPAVARTTWGDPNRYREVYFSTYPGMYFTGDGCRKNEKGMYRITGRVDDVINVSGHRISTAEVESAINEHGNAIESAVIGFPHPIKGEGLYAFVITQSPPVDASIFEKEVKSKVSELIGAFARPDHVQVVEGLPKTRSGKIMRRILRKIAAGQIDQLGDTSTLLDPSIINRILSGVKV